MVNVEVCRYTDSPSPLEDAGYTVGKLVDYIGSNMNPNDRGLIALSGGVDSSVVTRLCQEADVDVVAFHMDHGFMRRFNGQKESDLVCERFSDYPQFEFQEARSDFYDNIFGVEDADEKRARFREVYSTLLKNVMEKYGCNVFLDGTILPDIEETEAGIKLQHNPGLEDKYGAEKVIEPLAGLVKAEVRQVAKELDIPYLRPPFPGPGLAVRTPGAIDLERLEVEKDADDIVETGFYEYMTDKQGVGMKIGPNGEQIPFQYFAATFNGKRTPTVDTAKKSQTGREYLEELDISPERVRTLGTKVTGKTPDNKRVYEDGICISGSIHPEQWPEMAGIAEVPDLGVARVFWEIGEHGKDKYNVAIRAIDSIDARTATVTDVSPEFLKSLEERIRSNCDDVGSVLFDITPKPPGTIEYE